MHVLKGLWRPFVLAALYLACAAFWLAVFQAATGHTGWGAWFPAVASSGLILAWSLRAERQAAAAGPDASPARDGSEEELRVAREHLEKVVEFLPDATFVIDQDKKVIAWNRALELMTGTRKEDIIGQGDYAYAVPFCGERRPIIVDLTYDEGLTDPSHYEYVDRQNGAFVAETFVPSLYGGKGAHIWTAAWPLLDRDGRFTGAIESVRDISERKRVEEENRLHQQQLIQAERLAALGTLVSGVAHEINNPNFVVMSSATSLQNLWEDIVPILERHCAEEGDFVTGRTSYSELREDVPELFTALLKSSERIRYVVQELRDFAREYREDLSDTVSINAAVEAAVTLLSNMIKKSTLHFSVAYGDDLPAIRGDYRRLEQVAVNLVLNACQALTDKEQAISIRTCLDDGAGRVVLEVRDEGRGIPREDLGRIVDPFFTTRREIGGTGLGLSISSTIVQEHGGILVFDSEPGRGTTARVALPIVPACQEAAEVGSVDGA
ncbi:MAG: PAS domain S-box protein [Candidatus Hydrogenedentes bacterium]|nr:PAS domain S-box protein [Candidatus Hydrogenedentota bacterium]